MKNNKFIVRPKRYERLEPSKDSRKIYIYCEGDREDNYFKFFIVCDPLICASIVLFVVNFGTRTLRI